MADLAETLRHGGAAAIRHVASFALKTDPVHEALFRIGKRLDEVGVAYAICGGMALALHGYVRATVDVDLLVTPEGLRQAHEALEGRGYVPPFEGSKQLRDTEAGARIGFRVAGEYPGDGRPKPVAFPDPAAPGVAVEREGVKVVTLEKLLELKLASGMTATHRLKDLADVQQLIETLALPADFGDRLDPYVRAKYAELWQGLRGPRPDWDEPRRVLTGCEGGTGICPPLSFSKVWLPCCALIASVTPRPYRVLDRITWWAKCTAPARIEVALPAWLKELRRSEVVSLVQRDPRTNPGRLLGVRTEEVFQILCGGQADFESPYAGLAQDDLTLLYAYFLQLGHVEELVEALGQHLAG